MLAFVANLLRNPPDRGVIKEEGLQHILQQIDEIIVPPDMCQLMGQDGFELRRTQTGQQSSRHEHHRPGPADDHRHGRRGGPQEPHGRRHADSLLQARKTGAPHGVFFRLALSAQSADHFPTDCEAHREEDHADDPDTDQPVEPRSQGIKRLVSLCCQGNKLCPGRNDQRFDPGGVVACRLRFQSGIVAQEERAAGGETATDQLVGTQAVPAAAWRECDNPGSDRLSCGQDVASPNLP